MQLWKPWEQSTGPKSDEGKAVVARNAYKGAVRPKMRELSKLLKAQSEAVEGL